MSEYAKPLPVVTPQTQPFWDATRVGELRVQRCGQCGQLRFPPASICDECLSAEVSWFPVSGRGTVWSMCEFHRVYFKGFADEMPYNVVLVRLDEGPRMYSNIVGVAYADIEVGMRVQAVFDAVTDRGDAGEVPPSGGRIAQDPCMTGITNHGKETPDASHGRTQAPVAQRRWCWRTCRRPRCEGRMFASASRRAGCASTTS